MTRLTGRRVVLAGCQTRHPRREKSLPEGIGAGYKPALRSGVPAVVAQLEAAAVARQDGREAEPELEKPKPDGVLAGIEPMVIVG
jgi:hypothetical protein